MTCVDLLCDKGFRGCNKNNLPLRKPPIDCTPVNKMRSNADEKDQQLSITTPAMNVFPKPVGKHTRVLSKKQVLAMLYW